MSVFQKICFSFREPSVLIPLYLGTIKLKKCRLKYWFTRFDTALFIVRSPYWVWCWSWLCNAEKNTNHAALFVDTLYLVWIWTALLTFCFRIPENRSCHCDRILYYGIHRLLCETDSYPDKQHHRVSSNRDTFVVMSLICFVGENNTMLYFGFLPGVRKWLLARGTLAFYNFGCPSLWQMLII